jgi:transcriptional regulator with XRE-family HTH domain
MTAGIELRIGQRVLLARQAREWTQSQLAEASGVIQSTISRVEGGRVPTIAVLIQLAKALDVRPGWLLDGTAAGSEGLVAERIAKAEPMYGMAAARAALAVLDVLQRG